MFISQRDAIAIHFSGTVELYSNTQHWASLHYDLREHLEYSETHHQQPERVQNRMQPDCYSHKGLHKWLQLL